MRGATLSVLAMAAAVLGAAAETPSMQTKGGHVLVSSGGVLTNMTDSVSATRVGSLFTDQSKINSVAKEQTANVQRRAEGNIADLMKQLITNYVSSLLSPCVSTPYIALFAPPIPASWIGCLVSINKHYECSLSCVKRRKFVENKSRQMHWVISVPRWGFPRAHRIPLCRSRPRVTESKLTGSRASTPTR